MNSKEKRKSYDYRKKYLEHNHGLFGKYYFCSQCFKRLTKKTMEVDHILPNSKWYAPNRVFNCVAICPSCNKLKLDRVEPRFIIKGVLCKTLEELYVYSERILVLGFKVIYYGILFIMESLVVNFTSKNLLKFILNLLFILTLMGVIN